MNEAHTSLKRKRAPLCKYNKTLSDMSYFEIICIVFLCLFALSCFVVALVFSAWWHIGTGAMTSLLAWAIYQEDKPE